MSDSHDNGAAAKLRAYFEPDGFPGFTIEEGRAFTPDQVRQVVTHYREFVRQIVEPTVRAVLAENETMRQQLAGLRVVWESIYSSDEYDTKAEALAAATKDRFGTAAVDEDVTWRLVGEWQPAEGGE